MLRAAIREKEDLSREFEDKIRNIENNYEDKLKDAFKQKEMELDALREKMERIIRDLEE